MDGLLYQIDLKRKSFTTAEDSVATYILKNPQSIKDMTMQELAKRCHVSLSAVTRFSKTLGYKGYREFLVDFTYQLAVSEQGIFIDTETAEFNDDIPLNILNQNKVALSETHRLLDLEVIERVSKILFHAEKIICYGIGASELVARDFIMKLARLHKVPFLIPDVDFGKVLINQLGKNDVVFLISYSGEKKEVVEIAQFAKEEGKKVISLTRYGDTSLSRLADESLQVVAYENNFRSSALTSRFTQMYVVDIVFYTMLKHYEDKAYHLLKNTYYVAHEKE